MTNKETPLTDLNINSAECIAPQSNIGETVYHNICSGVTHVVPWGSADWFSAAFLGALILFLIVVFGLLGVMIFKTVIDTY